MNKPTIIIIGLIIAGLLFYGGYAYGSRASGAVAIRGGAATASSTYAGFAARGGAVRTGGAAGGSAITGSIVSSDATSITLAEQSGSVVVFYSTSTPITKTTLGSSADLSSGADVSVVGTTNSDGSVTASSIQIRPAGK